MQAVERADDKDVGHVSDHPLEQPCRVVLVRQVHAVRSEDDAQPALWHRHAGLRSLLDDIQTANIRIHIDLPKPSEPVSTTRSHRTAATSGAFDPIPAGVRPPPTRHWGGRMTRHATG